MWIVAAAWLYVTVMMALAEATSPQGSVLGAVITLVFYGLAPLALVLYLMGAPARRKALRAAEARAHAQHLAEQADKGRPSGDDAHPGEGSTQPDAGGLPAGDAIPPERKEP
ncbi:hypothetical protein JY96_19295 [Aquabacterium sp. NJ1]|uniref:hypothetical protein n=1 Tax=Aquabacterium sp. NJ1 TaxID=1538295 RepID=UPI00052C7F35|nr:hypothetical protein [Aquabacterium sp. NJ1]KGM41483.1 hypothetical protein JY96_19295 [Aquabacterium sp. NJ1]